MNSDVIKEFLRRLSFGRLNSPGVLDGHNNHVYLCKAIANTSTSTNASINYQDEGQPSPYFTVEEYGIVDTNLKGIIFV
ncbi:MAG: hypothetical protein ACRD5J_16385 [Nitrososphaeraceae archaeon]